MLLINSEEVETEKHVLSAWMLSVHENRKNNLRQSDVFLSDVCVSTLNNTIWFQVFLRVMSVDVVCIIQLCTVALSLNLSSHSV